MNRRIIRALLILAMGAASVTGGRIAGFPPCQSEDSVNCYWHAPSMGNGRGDSFLNVNGTIYYLNGGIR